MKRTLALFGATLQQVAHADRVEQASSRDSGAAASAHRSRAYVLGAGLVAAALAAGQVPAQAQVVLQGPQETQQQQARDRAGTIGGVLGLAAGLAAARNQNTVIKLVGAVAGYAAGSAIGEAAAAPSARDQQAQQMGVNGIRTDPLGPVAQTADARYATSMRGGRWGGEQVQLSRALYERYVQQSASPVPVSGTGLKPLSPTVHQGLYRLMVDTVAARAVAWQALDRVERLELEVKMQPHDPEAVGQYQRAQREYASAMREYGNSFTSAWDVIRTAEQSGFEISAQRGAMSVIPADMRESVQANLRWPGVDAKVMAMQNRATDGVDGATLSALNARADNVLQASPRDRINAGSR